MSSGSIRRSGTGARFESSERGGGGHGASVSELVGVAAELFGTVTSEAPPSGLSPGGGTVSARPSALYSEDKRHHQREHDPRVHDLHLGDGPAGLKGDRYEMF